jgi:hypothetical protein
MIMDLQVPSKESGELADGLGDFASQEGLASEEAVYKKDNKVKGMVFPFS